MGKDSKSLEEWMLEKGFTQRSLSREAEKLGFKLSDTSINLIVNGKRANARADTMRAIATVLGIEIRQVKEFDAMIETQLGKDLPATTISGTGRQSEAEAMVEIALALP